MKKTISILSLILTFVLLASTVFYSRYQNFISTPRITKAQHITVAAGESASTIAYRFTPYSFENKLYLRLLFKQHPEFLAIKQGTFATQAGWNFIALFDHLVTGTEVQHKITFIEGSTFKEWLAQIGQASELVNDIADLSEAKLLSELNIDAPKLEGMLLPETFFYPTNSKASDILRTASLELQAYLAEAWSKRAKNLPLKTPYEALILASIIEKETSLESERTTVASVFINRLNKGMKLQTDPTVIYGLGDRYKGDIKRKHLREKTAYNTYVIRGLPPTPIAMVGKNAIDAALNPANTKYLYFVASGNGGHYFSTNLREHNRAVRKYILKR